MTKGGSDDVLGVDVGTTYTAAAIATSGEISMLSLGSDRAAVPTVVVLREDGEVLVGEAADRRGASQPERTAREFKRRIGDPVPIVVGGTPYGAEALVAHVLRWVVAEATARLGAPPGAVALSHPASWSTYKTDLLRHAAEQAGLSDVTLITEPQAAAVHYADQAGFAEGATVAVYDLGGGTFDAAVVRRTTSGWDLLGVPEGLERFGGIDLDQAVFAHVDRSLDGMLGELDTSDSTIRGGLVRLRDECRKAKEALSTDTDTVIPVALPSLTTDVRLTRAEFESMARPRIAETVAALERAVASAGIATSALDRVLLVGGSSRMPLVAEMVHQALGVPVVADANPKLAIAYGAALAGRQARSVSDVAPVGTATALGVAGAAVPAPPTPVAATPPSVQQASAATAVTASPPAPPSPGVPPAGVAQPGVSGDRSKTLALVGGAVVLLLLLGAAAMAFGGGSDDGDQASRASSVADEDDDKDDRDKDEDDEDDDEEDEEDDDDEDDDEEAPETTRRPAPTTPPPPPPSAALAMQRLADFSGVLSAEVPSTWQSRLINPVDIGGVTAVQVSASTDQTGYAALTAPGVTILAADAADTGSPAEILALVAPAFTGTCTAQPSEPFTIGRITGVTQRWTGCAGGVSTAVVHTGTSADGVIYLISGVFLNDADETAYNQSIASISVAL